MKIAQLAPPWLSVPPNCYGGTEMIVSNLTEELVRRGHEVTLFATGDSKTSANLSYFYKKALGNKGYLKDNPYLVLPHYENCFKRADEFDIIHNHNEDMALFLADLVRTPIVHTLHGSFSKKDADFNKKKVLNQFNYHNFISISKSQRRPLKKLNFVANIYNGIDVNHFKFKKEPGKYLLWIGRLTKRKGAADAIKIAKRLGMELLLAGSIEPVEKEYLEEKVMPFVDGKQIKYMGEANYKGKVDLYRNALATISPIHWEEPYGLIMAESMACGTPVIAYKRGSVNELVKNGKTGFVIDPKRGISGMVSAVKKVSEIRREDCRSHIKENFNLEKMVDNYEEVYRKIVDKTKTKSKKSSTKPFQTRTHFFTSH